jgi:hypothetical protein
MTEYGRKDLGLCMLWKGICEEGFPYMLVFHMSRLTGTDPNGDAIKEGVDGTSTTRTHVSIFVVGIYHK